MPLPLGHTAIGILTLNAASKEKPLKTWLFLFFVIVFLANLPDVDVLFGLIFQDNGGVFHRGPTHSIVFSVFMGLAFSKFIDRVPTLPKLSFAECTSIIFSHVLADLFLTQSSVSLIWPIDVYFSSGLKSWESVLHSIINEAYKDLGIIAFTLVFLCLKYGVPKVQLYSKMVLVRYRK